MGSQIVIQIVLIAALVFLMFALFNTRAGARPQAIRRLSYLLLLVVAIFAVIFPGTVSWLASLVGVGRGTDLVVYILVLMLISHLISSRSSSAKQNQRFTELARYIAINEAEPAEEAGRRLSGK
ncbi:DUF2304 domain-containing protein [Propionimicrobium lymphophilum]|uniref:DUF2304 domain-containing protein n=1 Tax=Propionimicrobium lymphophilum TaxID=33012 RepID=UPI00254B65E4|nr:DUF2304 domain-containing protein [Propionimicrobium lymphophilum]MDK7710546.1 DUF2304 domain-containing protein [Propionimicrobium lymphophilum]MDK7733868.1 DUF2304 domain-containing protein [Propionimicrobium lymphophilum]